ncbi:DEAD/DEAH box helicase family protein [Staphylococcus nepalensis]|uniref:DEAD/DEAH box helicase n=1 Tax=Staphylococcus nepalensis TaxID=214473 RepID=UPI002B260A4E|nr:DEAD/DEAH box helicase family protein [Staphylococcus nepalensis]WQL21234.1 DEAD/DEAH box helicase family protein [Staphylococcus nepalensis]
MIPLRDYQEELVNGLYNSMSKGNKNIMVQSPAGSGKSVTMSEIARRATEKGNRVLFIVHRRELVSQIKGTFIANDVDMDLCHVGMVQTVANRIKKDKEPTPAIILVDEAHHALAKTYTDIFEHFPNAFVYGFTATPWRMSNKGFTDIFEDLILGKTVQWLIDNERLAPFKYYSKNLMNDNKLKHKSTGDFSNESISLALEPQIYGDVIDNYKKFAKDKKTIIYTHNVESSKEVAEKLNDNGYNALQVDGKTPKQQRELAMELFREGKVNILVNAELYGEGVDVPDCECVILLRPTESLTLFIQQTMRAMRYQPNKQAIIIDHVGNYVRHGLPNTEHGWLEHFNGSNKKSDSKNSIPIKECPECFGVVESAYTICPYCGSEFPKEEVQELTVDETAELEEVTEEMITLNLKAPEDCSSMKELADLGKSLGYKPGWSYIQGKRLGLIK